MFVSMSKVLVAVSALAFTGVHAAIAGLAPYTQGYTASHNSTIDVTFKTAKILWR